MRGVGAERARVAREVGLAPAMGVLQQPLLSSGFPQAPSSRAGQSGHHCRSFMDADDLFSGLPAPESASSQKNLLCAEGSEMVETFWMSELVRGCTGGDAHVVTATLPCLSVPWPVGILQGAGALAGWWPWRAWEPGEHPAVLTWGAMLQQSLGGCSWGGGRHPRVPSWCFTPLPS